MFLGSPIRFFCALALLTPDARAASATLLETQNNKLSAIIAENLSKQEVDFSPHGVMPGGPYKGDRLDESELRPVKILNGTPFESRLKRTAGDLILANLYHGGSFWIARVHKDEATKVTAMQSVFMPIAAHFMLLFELPSSPLERLGKIGQAGTVDSVELRERPLSSSLPLN